METVKINFGDFWPSFKKEDNYFTKILSLKYKVEIADDPDFYFFTHPYNGKRDYLKYKCHRIFLGWENERADWRICDYVLDSDFLPGNPRHKRWPLWTTWDTSKLTLSKKNILYAGKTKFCCMVVSNAKARERIEFFHALSKYKKVDSAGRYLNNIGSGIDNKMDFIRNYKFVLSFENSSYPGYTTEKLIEPMLVNSIPIYWGNPELDEDFNTRSFVHVNDFATYDEAIQHIIELDNNDDKYMDMVSEPWFKNNKVPEEFSLENMVAFFDFIIKDSKSRKPVATSIRKDYTHRAVLFKNTLKEALYHRLGIESGFR